MVRLGELSEMSLHPMENLYYRVIPPAVHPACCSPVAAPTGVQAPTGVEAPTGDEAPTGVGPRGAPPAPTLVLLPTYCPPIAVLADGSANEHAAAIKIQRMWRRKTRHLDVSNKFLVDDQGGMCVP